MKKVTLFLSVIGTAFLMTSCLGEGSNNYTEASYVYLDMDNGGTVYGKTISGYTLSRLITSNDMQLMDDGVIQIMSYSWDEEYGTTPLSIGGQTYQADNVRLGNKADIDHTWLLTEAALPVEENPKSFKEIGAPFYAKEKDFMGDYWLFEYAYEAEKAKKPIVEFYKRTDVNENDEIVIEIRLTFQDDSSATAIGVQSNAVAVNMTSLRNQSGSNKLKIRFKYYFGGELKDSQQSYEWDLSTN